MVIGLMVKVPVWPLHTWLPPAHTVAPTAGSVLLAGVLLKLGTYGLIRLVVPVVPQGFSSSRRILAVSGVVGIICGGFACLVERDLKRLVGLLLGRAHGFRRRRDRLRQSARIAGRVFANVAHGLMTGLLFLVAGGLKERSGGSGLMLRSVRACATGAAPGAGCWPSVASRDWGFRDWRGSGAACASPRTPQRRARRA